MSLLGSFAASPAFGRTRHAEPSEHPQPIIRELPGEVVAQIKSSTTITSLTGVVLELLKNSLDARATTIDIAIDYRRGSCAVEDNGLGIPPAEFREHGSLAKMYCMYPPPSDWL